MDRAPAAKTVRVTIFHQQYSVTSADQSSDIEELAQQVDELMVSIAQRAGNVDSTRVAVLACLHMADRLRSVEREFSDLKTRIGEKSKQFSLLLDRVIE